jgi:hypothetical protein
MVTAMKKLTHELESFGATCPDTGEVEQFMQEHGFTLTFSLPPQPGYGHNVPDLPAQYHYEDRYGTQVVYLAGHDHEVDGIQLPPHASRGHHNKNQRSVQASCTVQKASGFDPSVSHQRDACGGSWCRSLRCVHG